MTTTATILEPEADMTSSVESEPRPYHMTVEVYDRLVESGVFGDKSPIYLWKGRLVEPMTKGESHEFALSELTRVLVQLAGVGWHVRPGSPVRVRDDSKPEPDFVVLRGQNRDFRKRKPTLRDVAMLVEISDSSLAHDSGEKRDVYASASIPVYWVVNIPNQRIDVYTRPTGPIEQPRFESCQSFGPDDEVPVVLDGREVGRVAVKDVLF
jgi:Uma2 family endonuclease